ncbi:9474_t:CDS:2, partial [Ambispora gerdemannii]
RLVKNDKFKILPAHQFHYVKETKGTAEANAHLAFPELLQELTGFSGELVKSQKFWHYDTLRGANDSYVEPLVTELCQQIQQTNEPNLSEYLIKRHDIRQGNGYDCGVAVITITKRIIELTTKQS